MRGKDKASLIVKMNPGCEGGVDEPVNIFVLHACGISIVGLTTEGNVHLLKLFIMYQSNCAYGMYHKEISLDSLIVAVTKAIFFKKQHWSKTQLLIKTRILVNGVFQLNVFLPVSGVIN